MRIFASRQCAAYARSPYAGAGEARVARLVMFAVGSLEASCLVFVVSKPRWPRVPDLHLHRQKTPSSAIYLSRAYLNVSDCVTHIWPVPRPCLWYVSTFRVTFLSVTHHIRTYVRTHVRTHVLCENRSSIQSLALMRSPTSECKSLWGEPERVRRISAVNIEDECTV